MLTENPIEQWMFLLGRWRGIAEGESQENGKITSAATFSSEPSKHYIMGQTETKKDGEIINRSISFLFYDRTEKKFRRKTIFSYGFVNNEVEYERTADEIRFDVIVEPDHDGFVKLRWRSYIRKTSEGRIIMGLESAKPGEKFKIYSRTIYEKV